ncbi:MAG: hydrogenase expression/formation protein HypE [Clostridiales bacterium]|nr:hydrogenase expression/formation protein HypE [Clostridiales bacterium]
MKSGIITLAHGSGGAESAALMRDVFLPSFNNDVLGELGDSAVVCGAERLAISTDTFVVTPLVFPGGDIGKLAVCGTVNDVLMSGATPRYLTCGFTLEVGLSIELLDTICASLAKAAKEAGVAIIAGDTKVIEGRGEGGGLMISTTGVGTFGDGAGEVMPAGILPGDAIILSGNLGDHHAAILSARMGVKNDIKSDCALLTPIIRALDEAGVDIHAMRDVTRGGLATVLNELAIASKVSIILEEGDIPVSAEVKAFARLMGLDPLYMANEGKVALAVAHADASHALTAVRSTEIGRAAAIIGHAAPSSAAPSAQPPPPSPKSQTFASSADSPIPSSIHSTPPPLSLRTPLGGTIRLDVLYGEGLPRIC